MAYSLLHEWVSNVVAVQTDRTSITEMQSILHTVHMLIIESLASKFDNKNQKFGDTDEGRNPWRRVEKNNAVLLYYSQR